jgi:hypothetical protein
VEEVLIEFQLHLHINLFIFQDNHHLLENHHLLDNHHHHHIDLMALINLLNLDPIVPINLINLNVLLINQILEEEEV